MNAQLSTNLAQFPALAVRVGYPLNVHLFRLLESLS
jgi:hypothetical protein